ncbi:MAG: ABC transporter ATP-binding protein, partial [Lachnospiraceae bacterium]|nr:ABC transporter ATP-binding protein [Lachnospiraceae bacterium]
MARGPMPKNPGKILKRLMGYMFKDYKIHMLIVVIAILFSSLASVAGNLFLKNLIDDYITPMLGDGGAGFGALLKALGIMAVIYYTGVLSTYLYNRLMIEVSQGTLKSIRDDMFSHMEKLPIKYFDTHAHGDIMSHYTNDTDTLRQMISQSIPQLLSSVVTIVSTFVSMVVLSPILTVLVILMVVLMVMVSKQIGGRSARYFLAQQQDLGAVNGYIEEMMDGQKVVKVFCHEEKVKEEFDAKNEKLFHSADNANAFASMLMPIMANMGNINYVLTTAVGCFLAIGGVGGLTLGSLASFLQLTKSFNMPINQVAQQFNSIIMALAGADRIFTLLDEKVEDDNGYVTLVNAKEDKNGQIEEVKERTGLWAWRHKHGDGSVTYAKLQGEVVFDGVDFGYEDDKIVLHDIKLYANPGQKVAFVGATGAGKTTITNLINRFYDIQDGKIRYDNINVNKIKKDDLRRSLGIVLQDTHLFTGTVRDNIRYGKLSATDEEVIGAAKLANAHSFIEHLPDGYDTMLTGDGRNLSQG